MPELAEVEYYRKQWSRGVKQEILSVHLHADKRVFRGTNVAALQKTLRGATLLGSETHGKQMLFRFSKGGWLGLHLGMSGALRLEAADTEPLKHDHLVLHQARQNLVFSDPRQFGRVLFHHGDDVPAWWSDRPAEILSRQFTVNFMRDFLARHARAPIKGVLLMQSGFPGIGNWMADEILWQAKVHPATPAGKVRQTKIKTLHDKTQFVCRISLGTVGKNDGDLPKSWLFHHRWNRGGKCPIHGSGLKREEIGGRTTCWCPICQRPPVGV